MSHISQVHYHLFDDAARTASTNSSEFYLGGDAVGLLIELLVTVSASPQTLQMILQRKASDGSWHDYVSGTAQAVTAGPDTFWMVISLGTTLGGNFSDTRRAAVAPGTYRVRVIHSGAGTWNYSGDVFFMQY